MNDDFPVNDPEAITAAFAEVRRILEPKSDPIAEWVRKYMEAANIQRVLGFDSTYPGRSNGDDLPYGHVYVHQWGGPKPSQEPSWRDDAGNIYADPPAGGPAVTPHWNDPPLGNSWGDGTFGEERFVRPTKFGGYVQFGAIMDAPPRPSRVPDGETCHECGGDGFWHWFSPEGKPCRGDDPCPNCDGSGNEPIAGVIIDPGDDDGDWNED